MTPGEFREALRGLGLTQRALAARLGVIPVTVSRWATGQLPVPQYAVAYLRVVEQLAAEGIAA